MTAFIHGTKSVGISGGNFYKSSYHGTIFNGPIYGFNEYMNSLPPEGVNFLSFFSRTRSLWPYVFVSNKTTENGDPSTDQELEEVSWDSILEHIKSYTEIDSLSAFQGWLAPHLHDVLCCLRELIPLNIHLDIQYERNDFTGTKELTRHLQLRGRDRELMTKFRAFLYERKLLPESPQSIFQSLMTKADSFLNQARQVAKEFVLSAVDNSIAVLKTIYAPDTQKYPPIQSPGVVILQSLVKISDGVTAISLGSIRYSFF